MKFYGNNSEYVFDSKRGCALCKFSNGELTTTDKYVIERLKELGYKSEEKAKAQTKTNAKPKAKG